MNSPEIKRAPLVDDGNSQPTEAGDSLSMHSGVPVWCDCCTCEAEPYWTEAFDGDEAISDSGRR